MWLLRIAVLAVLGTFLLPLQKAFGQDSLNVTQVARYNVWGTALDLAVAGELAYVTTGNTGFHILDISNPATPRELGSVNTPGQDWQVALSGTYAYVVHGNPGGLHVVDVSNPRAPVEVNVVFPDTSVQGVHVVGSLLFAYYRLADRWVILDISNPASPQHISNLTPGGLTENIAIRDSLAYILNLGGLRIFDFSNLANPVEVGSWYAWGEVPSALTVSGDYAYVSTFYHTLKVLDLSDPTAPFVAASIPTEGYGTELVVSGASLYMTGRNAAELQIFDIATPTQPVLTGSFTTDCQSGEALVVAPNRAYYVAICGSLHVLDTSDPANPVQIGVYDTPGSVYDVKVVGNHAYFFGSPAVADVSDPLWPVMLGELDSGDCVPPAVVQEPYVYTAAEWSDGPLDEQGGLRIVDVSIPSAPLLVGAIYDPMDIGSIAVSNGMAYVTTGGWGITIIDVSNPLVPVSAGFYADPSVARSVAAEGTILFYARGWPVGLYVLDVSDPSAPVELAFLSTVCANSDMLVNNGLLYAASDSGLFVADVSDPAAPVLLGSYLVAGGYGDQQLELQGSLVYLADKDYGVRVFDVSNPAEPALAGYYQVPGTTWAMAARDSVVYVAGGDHVGIYRFGPPVSVPRRDDGELPRELTLSAYPNPFNSTSTFLMEVPPGPREITITVFDLLGREVRREVKPVTSAHMIYRFDASALASGVYFARVETPDVQRTVKLMLLR